MVTGVASSASQGLVDATPGIVAAGASVNRAATAAGLLAINGAVDTAVAVSRRTRPVARRIARSTGQAALTAGQAALGAGQAMGQAALGAGGQVALGAGHLALGVGQSALGAGQAAGQALVDYGPSVASAVGNSALTVGQTLAQGASAAGSGALHVAMQAPSFASHAAKTTFYLAKHTAMTFDDLMTLIEHAPKAPILDNPKRRRSQSPAVPALGDQAAASAAETPFRTHQHGVEPLHFATEEEWVKMGKGGLVNQLQLRPDFHAAMGIRHNQQNLRKIFKDKSTQQLAQLIMKLDAKAA
jgi:hypothetical protein